MKRTSPLLFGIASILAMIALYYALLASLTGDSLHPFILFIEKWYFLAPLILGFGVQMFLFQRLRLLHLPGAGVAGVSTGTSGIAMAACCAHHLADVVPVLGLLGISTFMAAYVDWFLAFGTVMNVVGALFLWYHHRHALRCSHLSPHAPAHA
jgi:hypothetical protein